MDDDIDVALDRALDGAPIMIRIRHDRRPACHDVLTWLRHAGHHDLADRLLARAAGRATGQDRVIVTTREHVRSLDRIIMAMGLVDPYESDDWDHLAAGAYMRGEYDWVCGASGAWYMTDDTTYVVPIGA